MPWILGILGALFGAFLADEQLALFGLLAGATLGVLVGSHWVLRRRVDELSGQMARAIRARNYPSERPAPAHPDPAKPSEPPSAPARPGATAWPDAARAQSAAPPPRPAPPPRSIADLTAARDMDATPGPAATLAAYAIEPTLDERISATLRRWLFEGNLPVKIGAVLIFLGVGYLLKLAVDEGWFALPIEFRYLGVAAGALVALAWGWLQRHSKPVFALSLQGAALGVLLLLVFSAYGMHALLPSGLALALAVALVASGALLAVLQHSLALALLAFIGGYLAPVLIDTGSGDHVALFACYALLNLAVLGIAWFRSWRALNLVGFAFTFAVGTLWGFQYYQPHLRASVLPFLGGFFLFYVAIPVLHALRGEGARRGFVDGVLVFGAPVLAFPLAAALLDNERMELAYCALGVATLYAALTAWLIRRTEQRLLAQSFAVLAVAFATLAVPLALSALWTSAVWALQGAALVWLGLRQSRRFPVVAGWLLQGLAAASWCWDVMGEGWSARPGEWPLLNGHALGLLCMALGGLAVSWLHERVGGRRWSVWPPFLLGLWWWSIAGAREIDVHGIGWRGDAPWVAFAASTMLLAALLRRGLPWPRLGWPAAALLVAGSPLALLSLDASGEGPLNLPDGAVWLAWIAAALLALRELARDPLQRGLSWAHVGLLAGIATLAGAQLWAMGRDALSDGWREAAAIAPLLALAWLGQVAPRIAGWPLATRFFAYQGRWGLVAALGLAAWWVLTLDSAGGAQPLPYVPLLNPLELAQLLVLLFFVRLARDGEADVVLRLALPAAGFVLLTTMTLRGVHHATGAPWSPAILDSFIAQTALTVAWSVAGVGAWIAGSKRRSRPLWTAGAALMALVLLKLALVDRGYIGDLPGIVSFLAVGVLLVLVGWFAPSPPRRETETA
ncbi:MAG: DUF2339 domain-containing protein [Pseudomonadota bacterium]